MSTVVQTDHAWPDVNVERAVLTAAGHRLVAPLATATAAEVEAVVVAVERPAAEVLGPDRAGRNVLRAQQIRDLAHVR